MIWQNFYIWEGPFSDRTESARFKAPIPTNQSGGIYTHEARTCYRTADSEPAGSMLPANAQAAEGMFGASAAGQVQTMTEGAGEDGVQTENTADIDGTQYATLAEAVAQAEEGATIRLLRDVELDASGWSTARER